MVARAELHPLPEPLHPWSPTAPLAAAVLPLPLLQRVPPTLSALRRAVAVAGASAPLTPDALVVMAAIPRQVAVAPHRPAARVVRSARPVRTVPQPSSAWLVLEQAAVVAVQ